MKKCEKIYCNNQSNGSAYCGKCIVKDAEKILKQGKIILNTTKIPDKIRDMVAEKRSILESIKCAQRPFKEKTYYRYKDRLKYIESELGLFLYNSLKNKV